MTANITTASFKATGGTASRSLGDHVVQSVNVLDFSGVVGDNSTDSTAGIQAAIDYASTIGWGTSGPTGGEVFFPAGDYVVSAPLRNNTGNSSIRIRGAGCRTTRIHGAFTGFAIDTDDSTTGNITLIEGLNITNYRNNVDAGGIRFNNSEIGTIRDCVVGGFTGIDAHSNAFNSRIESCDMTPPGATIPGRTAGTVGINAGQVGIYNCALLGWDSAIVCSNAGTDISGSRTESSNTGIVLNSIAGFSICAHTTERCGTSIDLVNASSGVISGCALTGTVAGENLAITSITRSGVTATATTTVAHGLSGTALLTINGAVQGDYDGQFLCTITGANTFTYTVANSPVTPATGTLIYLNTPSYGIRVRNVGAVKIEGVIVSAQCSVAGVHMGAMTGGGLTLDTVVSNVGSAIGQNWIMPETNNTPTFFASSVQFVNCNNTSAAFPFSNLPSTPVEGMVFAITDGQKSGTGTALFGDTVVGGASQHISVRYNGTNWTRNG